ncbi:MAG: FAD-dependent oxidoreductase [Chlorobi bacterium]|nr:FAD-dependent oxidoreductase [Chlorobiota bacterium]MCI0717184.1 FAD-dependent oxidoreductase [Chlorobiota bacterium]
MKKKLVVLGSGFGAFSCLKEINYNLFDVKIVSPRNHFLFTCLLPSTTVGTIEFRSIIEPIRNIKKAHYIQAYCNRIVSSINEIHCEDSDTKKTFELEYDTLVISVGEVTNTFNIEGVKEYAYFLREAADARKIRIKVIDCFENASLPNISEEERRSFLRFVVCGGGPTGVEFAAELHDFIEEDVRKNYKGLDNYIEVILIEAGDKLLNTFDEKLSQYTMKIFKRQRINVKTNSYITRITKNEIYVNDGSHFKYGLLVWATGNTATDLIKNCDLPKNEHNKIIVDRYLKVKDTSNIYGLGDCSEIPEEPYPATAQTAQRQGKYLGKSLNKIIKGKNVKPFRYKDLGMLAYIGSHKALANIRQYKGSGFAAWLFWRSVYITKLVSLKNKVLVLFDWFKTFVFGRDISNF